MIESRKNERDDELINLVYESVKQQLSSEEKREQRISYVLSTVGKFDEQTRKEVEKVVDEAYG